MFRPLNCRGGCYFCRHKSNQKGFQQKGFFAAHGHYPANQAKPRAAKCCPTAFSQPCASATIAMPFLALGATIVLPDFARSWSADGEHHDTFSHSKKYILFS